MTTPLFDIPRIQTVVAPARLLRWIGTRDGTCRLQVGEWSLCINREGKVVVIKAAPIYELLAVNSLGEKSQATPAVADDKMYLRTYSHLILIGSRVE